MPSRRGEKVRVTKSVRKSSAMRRKQVALGGNNLFGSADDGKSSDTAGSRPTSASRQHKQHALQSSLFSANDELHQERARVRRRGKSRPRSVHQRQRGSNASDFSQVDRQPTPRAKKKKRPKKKTIGKGKNSASQDSPFNPTGSAPVTKFSRKVIAQQDTESKDTIFGSANGTESSTTNGATHPPTPGRDRAGSSSSTRTKAGKKASAIRSSSSFDNPLATSGAAPTTGEAPRTVSKKVYTTTRQETPFATTSDASEQKTPRKKKKKKKKKVSRKFVSTVDLTCDNPPAPQERPRKASKTFESSVGSMFAGESGPPRERKVGKRVNSARRHQTPFAVDNTNDGPSTARSSFDSVVKKRLKSRKRLSRQRGQESANNPFMHSTLPTPAPRREARSNKTSSWNPLSQKSILTPRRPAGRRQATRAMHAVSGDNPFSHRTL